MTNRQDGHTPGETAPTGNNEEWTLEEMRDWIDHQPCSELLRWWRFAPTGDPFFQGETGKHYPERGQQGTPPPQQGCLPQDVQQGRHGAPQCEGQQRHGGVAQHRDQHEGGSPAALAGSPRGDRTHPHQRK